MEGEKKKNNNIFFSKKKKKKKKKKTKMNIKIIEKNWNEIIYIYK